MSCTTQNQMNNQKSIILYTNGHWDEVFDNLLYVCNVFIKWNSELIASIKFSDAVIFPQKLKSHNIGRKYS